MLSINLGTLQAGLSTTCFGPAKLELFGARKTAIDYSSPKLVVENMNPNFAGQVTNLAAPSTSPSSRLLCSHNVHVAGRSYVPQQVS